MDSLTTTPARRRLGLARLLASALAFVLAAPGVSSAASPFEEASVETEHTIVVEGAALNYRAETGRIAIRNAETGEPHGYMFYIAYRMPSERPRPLAFVWNGGPGANSALLHFEAAGPKRYEGDVLVDNADTWLTDMDLVFVDPIGTGFSRPAKAEYADEFYGTIGDVASVTEFVRAWRLLHDAPDAPLLLIGESWGAGRAGNVGYALEQRGIGVHALVLISGGAGLSDNPVPGPLRQALRVADLSATARYHHRLPEEAGHSESAVRARAEDWAREIYAPALKRVDQLDDSERTAVIDGLVRFTGVPRKAIDPDTLVITPRAYREKLLGDIGQILQVFDMRLTVSDPAAVHGEDEA
jgi:carboxypeptidase C (cathepsin A)